jgi:probable O-glycosylation ligase (exosortase A-associated)
MNSQRRIHLLVAVIAASLAFYGVKGGLFTVLSGGNYRVYGPPGSFIDDNNTMGLALILVVPLLRYLQLEAKDKWFRWSLGGGMVLTAFAILGTQSRGALLGLVAMGLNLIWKSQGRWKMLIAAAVLAPMLWTFMPESWHSRMNTIETYQEDKSALGRINAWWFAFNLAVDRPLVGGGFATFTEELFQRYAPNPEDVHDAHSIYFEALGEQGFVGLALFLTLGLLTFLSAQWVVKHARGPPELRWARNLAAMIQVSLIGYAVSGAFLGLAYFDLVYHLIVIVVVTRACVEQALRARTMAPVAAPAGAAAGPPASASIGGGPPFGSRGTT